MTFFDKTYSEATLNYRPDPLNFSPGPMTSEGFDTSWLNARTAFAPDALGSGRREYYDPILDKLKDAGVEIGDKFNWRGLVNSESLPEGYPYQSTWYPAEKDSMLNMHLEGWNNLNELLLQHPELGITLQKPEDVDAAIKARAPLIEQEINTRAERLTFKGHASSMGAYATSYLLDIIRDPGAAAMTLGGVGLASKVARPLWTGSAWSSIKRVAGIEALVGGGVEVYMQPKIKAWRDEVGLEYSWTQVAIAIGAGAAIGGVFGGSLEGLRQGLGVTLARANPGRAFGRKMHDWAGTITPQEIDTVLKKISNSQINDLLNILAESGVRISPEGRAAAAVSNVDRVVRDENPLTGADSDLENIERTLRAEVAVSNPEIAEPIPSRPVSEEAIPPGPDPVHYHDNLDEFIFRFDPNEIGVDAKTFQFKAGGDEFGVGERLQGVTKWDKASGANIMVYEYADGRRFIADGHQRLGLAKRIMSQDPSQEIILYGTLMREVDGVTPAQARVAAALQNVRADSGTALDAAKVLRDDPSKLPNLPPRSALVQHAEGIVRLSDEAYMLVINEIVEPQYAAIVGRLVDDPQKQIAILRVLAQTEPTNITQAEIIIRQALAADFAGETQVGLFGEEFVLSSLFKERAMVYDAAEKLMRSEGRMFNNLIENANQIEAAGNQLATGSNVERVTTNATALQIVKALANRKGATSDALTAASRKFKETGNKSAAAREFVEHVRSSIERGDITGETGVSQGRSVDAAAQADTIDASPATKNLEAFDDPRGKGVDDQGDALQASLEEELLDPVAARGETVEAADPEGIKDLERLIKSGASIDDIEAHPAVIRAWDRMEAIPLTKKMEGYGTAEWKINRVFNFEDETLVGYEAGITKLYENAKGLGWTDDLLTPQPIRQDRNIVIIVGPPASGKSFFANKFARARKAAIIDPDEAKKVLPEFEGGIGANAVHAESKVIMQGVEKRALENGDNIVLPTVGHDKEKLQRRIKMFQDAGYSVDLINMSVSSDTAYQRMFSRFISQGRFINPEYLRLDVGNKPGEVYHATKKGADRYASISNEGPIKEAKDVLEESGDILQGVDIQLRRGGRGVASGDGKVGARTQEVSGVADLERPLVTEPTPQGEQVLIEGVEPVSTRARLAVEGERPLRGGEAEAGPLFDEGARAQQDLLDQIPVGVVTDPTTREVVPILRTRQQILADIDQEKAMLGRLEDCV